MSELRETVAEIIGKRVERVFVRHLPNRQQLYLVFDDSTYIELYGSFQCSSQLRSKSLVEFREMFARDLHLAQYVEYSVPVL